MNKGGVFGAVVLAVLGLVATPADAGNYKFTLLAAGSAGKPAINNAGHVAYYAREPVNSNVSLYVWDGTQGRLAIQNDQDNAISSQPVIADGDRVAMTRYRTRETVVWDPVGGQRVLYPPDISRSVSAVNRSGAVLLVALSGSNQEVWVGDGGPQTLVRSANTNLAGNGYAAINAAGVVAVYERNASLTEEAIQVLAGGAAVEIASRASGHRFMSIPSISDSGFVAFASEHSDGTGGVYLTGNGMFGSVVGGLGFRPFSVAVNDAGEVAYHRVSGTSGIYVGADPLTGKVIAAGDPLFGSTVSFVELGNDGLNNNGELAFYARLNDGRSVAVLAQPVPEPASGTLFAAIAMAALNSRRRRAA